MVQAVSGTHPSGTKLGQGDLWLLQPEITLSAFRQINEAQAYISSSTMTGT